jgi:hypothetical protein
MTKGWRLPVVELYGIVEVLWLSCVPWELTPMGHLSHCAIKRLITSFLKVFASACDLSLCHASQDIPREQRQWQDLALFGENLLKRVAIANNAVARIENSFSGMDETAIFLRIPIDACHIRSLGALKHAAAD